MAKVFISYSRSDLGTVLALEQRIGQRVSLWRDQEKIYGGDRWPKVLGEAIDANDTILLVWSQHSAASHYVEFEWCTALALRKRIIPWILDETPLPPSLRAANGLDARIGEPAVMQLIKSFGRRLPAADRGQSSKVIGELGQISAKLPEAVALAAKAIFNQHNWVVYGNVFQAAGDQHITIQAPKKPRRPKPQIRNLNHASTSIGEEIGIEGINFGSFEDGKCSVMVGPREGHVDNWSPTRINVRVPAGLKPGSYQVSVRIDDLNCVSPSPLAVALFPVEIGQALLRGERSLLLVAQVEGDSADQLVQADLLEQIRLAVDEKPKLRDSLLIAPWPETFSGPNALLLAQRHGKEQGAQLVLFGRMGESRTLYPRLAVSHVSARSFGLAEERLSSVTAKERALQQEQHTLSAEPVDRPVRLLHFITGWYQHEKRQFAEARRNFLEVLEGELLTSIDAASFRYKAGEASFELGTEILERPYRSEQDVREGEALIREGIEHFQKAAEAFSELEDRKDEAARVFIKRALAVSSLPSLSTGERHRQAIEDYQKALELLDCDEDLEGCILAYGNLASSQEWYADIQWKRKDKDDLLEQSHANTARALEFVELKAKRLGPLGTINPDEQSLIDFERAWFKNALGIDRGRCYRGDRDANLEEAIRLNEEALPEFEKWSEKEPDQMIGRIALTYNHIGCCYINLARGSRPSNLSLARAALEKGVVYVGPQQFPEFLQMLNDNLGLVAELEQRDSALQDYEIARRFEAEFVPLQDAGDYPNAEKCALGYLNWNWKRFAAFSPYAANAHYQLGSVAESAGSAPLALRHYCSARVILSARQSWSESDMEFAKFLDGKLSTLWGQLGYSPGDVYHLLARASHGYRLRSQLKQEGDQSLNDKPMKALSYYDQALDIFPHDPFTLVNRSIARRTLGDLDGYVQDLSNALLIYPDDPIACFNRSTIYSAAQRWEDALRDLDVAVEVNPDEANFRLARAECFEALGNAAMAVQDYEAALLKVSDPEVSEVLQAKLKKLTAGESR
jgi:tetratricopeptide (TPR) repeat protein